MRARVRYTKYRDRRLPGWFLEHLMDIIESQTGDQLEVYARIGVVRSGHAHALCAFARVYFGNVVIDRNGMAKSCFQMLVQNQGKGQGKRYIEIISGIGLDGYCEECAGTVISVVCDDIVAARRAVNACIEKYLNDAGIEINTQG